MRRAGFATSKRLMQRVVLERVVKALFRFGFETSQSPFYHMFLADFEPNRR